MGIQGTADGHDNEQSIREVVRQELSRMKTDEDSDSVASEEESMRSSGGSDGKKKNLKALRQLIHKEILEMQGTQQGAQEKSHDSSDSKKNSQNSQKHSSSHEESKDSKASDVGESSKSKRAKVHSKGSETKEQSVAEVLTHAQYELSQELETNLKKLRSVIRQSQEIASKIEQVLGHGTKGSGNKE